jgi:hypothetical protein
MYRQNKRPFLPHPALGWQYPAERPVVRPEAVPHGDHQGGHPYRLRFLGDRKRGGTPGLCFPVLRDVRLDDPPRFFGLRSVHVAPFVDGDRSAQMRWSVADQSMCRCGWSRPHFDGDNEAVP